MKTKEQLLKEYTIGQYPFSPPVRISELADLRDSIYLAMEAYSDQQNKELREWKRGQLEVWGPVADYLMTRKDIRLGERMSVRVIEILKNQDAEIQRLTKELNDLGVKFDKELERWQERDAVELFRRKQLEMDCANRAAELTRLRELLGKAKNWIYDNASEEATANDERQNLLTEIDNALNHKP